MIEVEDTSEEIEFVPVIKSPLKEAVSPSKKKRKLDSPLKLNQSSLDDGSLCSICLDNFNCSGEHRTVALKCGHLYGNSCITTWIKDNKNCPSCKSKASTRDFRFIYATKVQIVDNSREVELELQLQKVEQEKRDIQAMSSQNAMTIALQKRQIKELTREIERLKSMQLKRSNSNELTRHILRSGRMYLEKSIEFKDNADCRIIKFMPKSKKLIISQKAVATSLFTGYGVRFVDVNSHRCEKFINTSSKQVIDMCFDPSETYLATASREPVCKVYNILSSQSIAVLAPTSSSPIWSCSFNKNRENQIFLGAQDGSLHMYDFKKSAEVLQIQSSLDNKTPVKLILSMYKNDAFTLGGFFVIHLRGLYFYEYKDSSFEVTKLNYEDSIVTASYDDRTELLLLSTPTEDKMMYILMKLIKVDEVPVLQESYRFYTNQTGVPFITRPAQIKVNDSFIVASYSNESRDIQLYTPEVGKLHSIVMQNPVLDTCSIYNTDNSASTSFAALSSTKCRIFKINLEYG
ncbi:E3 ubiquitin-protein ligase rfwd3.L-like [Chironomus tepperi]|uniref:E3 ubiquitin-protein ligase rfwd3.L-like n=1 Tax=Chironomus tepperi TaxID=113505 RepID=UPI00391F5071